MKRAYIDANVILRFLTGDPPDMAAQARALGKNIDFADALVAVHMRKKGMQEIFSFDRDFDRLPVITRLTPGEALPEN